MDLLFGKKAVEQGLQTAGEEATSTGAIQPVSTEKAQNKASAPKPNPQDRSDGWGRAFKKFFTGLQEQNDSPV